MSKRHGHKKFTDWDYEGKEVQFKVPVLLVDKTKTAGSSRCDDEETTYFAVELPDLDIKEKDTDINRLRKTVFKKITDALSIEWRGMLVVEVSASRQRLYREKDGPATPKTDDRASGSLHLNWERWQIAEFRGKKISRRFIGYSPDGILWGGTEATRDRADSYERWHHAHDGWPEVADYGNYDDYDDEHPRITALIPDTPENRLALEAIASKIEEIYAGLAFLLGSEQIETTLAKVASNGLLALPAPPTKRVAKKK